MKAWRHPRPIGHAGRCIGARTDLAVDPRKAKRLAHRIRATARREGLPRAVVCSPLRRCRAVAAWLRRWGWRRVVDARLAEMDFGAWDGLRWSDIGREAVDAWCADFARHPPGGGECVAQLMARAQAWQPPAGVAVLIGHAGWLAARGLRFEPLASDWPAPLPFGGCLDLPEPALR
jgi:alpha-ribazole phosphatase